MAYRNSLPKRKGLDGPNPSNEEPSPKAPKGYPQKGEGCDYFVQYHCSNPNNLSKDILFSPKGVMEEEATRYENNSAHVLLSSSVVFISRAPFSGESVCRGGLGSKSRYSHNLWILSQ